MNYNPIPSTFDWRHLPGLTPQHGPRPGVRWAAGTEDITGAVWSTVAVFGDNAEAIAQNLDDGYRMLGLNINVVGGFDPNDGETIQQAANSLWLSSDHVDRVWTCRNGLLLIAPGSYTLKPPIMNRHDRRGRVTVSGIEDGEGRRPQINGKGLVFRFGLLQSATVQFLELVNASITFESNVGNSTVAGVESTRYIRDAIKFSQPPSDDSWYRDQPDLHIDRDGFPVGIMRDKSGHVLDAVVDCVVTECGQHNKYHDIYASGRGRHLTVQYNLLAAARNSHCLKNSTRRAVITNNIFACSLSAQDLIDNPSSVSNTLYDQTAASWVFLADNYFICAYGALARNGRLHRYLAAATKYRARRTMAADDWPIPARDPAYQLASYWNAMRDSQPFNVPSASTHSAQFGLVQFRNTYYRFDLEEIGGKNWSAPMIENFGTAPRIQAGGRRFAVASDFLPRPPEYFERSVVFDCERETYGLAFDKVFEGGTVERQMLDGQVVAGPKLPERRMIAIDKRQIPRRYLYCSHSTRG